MITTVAEVTVGSTLHGLNTPESDVDTVLVYMEPLSRVISPFYKRRAKVADDHTRMELSHLCYLLAKGNPTALELLWSDQVRGSEIWTILQEHRHLFLGWQGVYDSHRGYASEQAKKMDTLNDKRKVKACIARARVLIQGLQLLDSGTFSTRIGEPMATVFKDYKANPTYELYVRLKGYGDSMVAMLDNSVVHTSLRQFPDTETIEQLILDLYLIKHLG